MSEHDRLLDRRDHPAPTCSRAPPGRRRGLPRGVRHVGPAVGARGPGATATAPPPGAARRRRADAEHAPSGFANWPVYIDQDENSPPSRPPWSEFTAKTAQGRLPGGVNDNEEFFGTIQPPLQAGQDTGWDLVVLTDWMAARLIRLGWVETIDTANTPNFVANLQRPLQGRRLGPGHELRGRPGSPA